MIEINMDSNNRKQIININWYFPEFFGESDEKIF
jgi:hypothetical protein